MACDCARIVCRVRSILAGRLLWKAGDRQGLLSIELGLGVLASAAAVLLKICGAGGACNQAAKPSRPSTSQLRREPTRPVTSGCACRLAWSPARGRVVCLTVTRIIPQDKGFSGQIATAAGRLLQNRDTERGRRLSRNKATADFCM